MYYLKDKCIYNNNYYDCIALKKKFFKLESLRKITKDITSLEDYLKWHFDLNIQEEDTTVYFPIQFVRALHNSGISLKETTNYFYCHLLFSI